MKNRLCRESEEKLEVFEMQFRLRVAFFYLNFPDLCQIQTGLTDKSCRATQVSDRKKQALGYCQQKRLKRLRLEAILDKAAGETRTHDPRFTKAVLYQLSYSGFGTIY